jgi:C4-dicarboxylate transporter DctM subunit
MIADSLLALTTNIHLIWILIITFLLFVGMFMETLAAIMILTPVLLPITYSLGIDPVHFGIVMVCSLSIGFSTPPLGENLFVASGISNLPLEEVIVKALPFTFVSTIAVLIIAFIPEISLFLPRLFGY